MQECQKPTTYEFGLLTALPEGLCTAYKTSTVYRSVLDFVWGTRVYARLLPPN